MVRTAPCFANSYKGTNPNPGSITQGIERRQQQQQQPMANPAPSESSAKAKKPPMTRRATSSKFPQKGQEFSVDDAEEEVELDQAQQDQQKKPRPNLRKKPST